MVVLELQLSYCRLLCSCWRRLLSNLCWRTLTEKAIASCPPDASHQNPLFTAFGTREVQIVLMIGEAPAPAPPKAELTPAERAQALNGSWPRIYTDM